MDTPPVVRAIAPGRVTLIGDHTDYAGGRSLAMAIPLATTASFHPRAQDRLDVTASGTPPRISIDLSGPRQGRSFTERLIEGLVDEFDLAQTRSGGRLLVATDLPIGAGLSSSASFTIACALCLGTASQPRDLALLAQRVEQRAGANVGLLDQITITEARRGHGVVIDFARLTTSQLMLPEQLAWTVVDTGISRGLVDAPYADRRHDVEAATALLGPLAHASSIEIASIPDPRLRARARHVRSETERVGAMVDALRTADFNLVGAILDEGHRSLAKDFDTSLPEIDALAHEVRQQPGVFGVRLCGAGFGGCLIVAHEFDADCSGLGVRSWPVVPCDGASLR